MTIKIYYTVEKQTQTKWFERNPCRLIIEVRNDEYSEKEIQTWLDNNGFKDREYDMIWL